MDKKKSMVWVISFLLLITVPTLLGIISGQETGGENYENRVLASMPKMDKKNYENFPEEFEKYYNDNLPLRNELINLNNKISYYIFKDSPSNQVLLGKNEWLFYMGGSVQTSTGQTEIWDEELVRIAENLNNAQKYFEHEGIEFVVFIAPNKATIYKELLPDNYPIVSEKTRGEILADYLHENTNVRVIFPVDELKDIKGEYESYLQFDTHWNNLGAYVGAKELNEQFGIKMSDVSELDMKSVPEAKGDLEKMTQINFEGTGKDYHIAGYDNELKDEKYVMEYHNEKGDTRNVVVKKDSFGVRLAQYFTPEYKNSYFVSDDEEKYIKEFDADIFVYEVVERNATSIWLDLDFIETEIKQVDGKKEIIFSSMTTNPLNYVSIFKANGVSGEIENVQVMTALSQMKLEVSAEETGEIYIYIFEDAQGHDVLEEINVKY